MITSFPVGSGTEISRDQHDAHIYQGYWGTWGQTLAVERQLPWRSAGRRVVVGGEWHSQPRTVAHHGVLSPRLRGIPQETNKNDITVNSSAYRPRIAIIGAGPAGLAAANATTDIFDTTLFDAGPSITNRSQNDASSLLLGVGGAGLYSDGKFSYYPSASNLWQHQPLPLLKRSYEWFRQMSTQFGLNPPPFPDNVTPPTPDVPFVIRKNYRSDYLTLDQRIEMIRYLARARDNYTIQAMQVVDIQSVGDCPTRESISIRTSDQRCFSFDATIIATGRFGPLLLSRIFKTTYKRAEIGLRIQQPADEFLFREDDQVDSKVILTDRKLGVQWRTFCCCRDGLVAPTRFGNLTIFSGRADCPPTGKSNIGFLLRILDPKEGARAWDLWKELLELNGSPAHSDLPEFIESPQDNPIARLYGWESANLLASGIQNLLDYLEVPKSPSGELYAPVIEGVGAYPVLDRNLRVGLAPLWAAGDVTGDFRGLVAALVSGFMAGLSAVGYLLSLHRPG
jgi:uncharacterized FAD-dependent dehydrogenase